MTDADREPAFDEMATALRDLRVPVEGREATVARARATAAGGPPPLGSPPSASAPDRRGPIRPRALAALVAGVLIACAGLLLGVTRPWSTSEAPHVPASRVAAERIAADPLLSRLVWITGGGIQGGPARIQSLPDAPSLVFPPGVTFAQAFNRLLVSLGRDGRLPPEARLGRPLPLGRTVRLPAGPGQGIALDLRSPRGYLLPGGIIPSGFSADPSWSAAEGERRIAAARRLGLVVPPGALVPVPRLEACQVLVPGASTPRCVTSPPLPGPAASR